MFLIERLIVRFTRQTPAEALTYAHDALGAAYQACRDAKEWVDGPWADLTEAQRVAMVEVRAAADAALVVLDGFDKRPAHLGRWRRVLRLLPHRHDPIECGCELSRADAPKTGGGAR